MRVRLRAQVKTGDLHLTARECGVSLPRLLQAHQYDTDGVIVVIVQELFFSVNLDDVLWDVMKRETDEATELTWTRSHTVQMPTMLIKRDLEHAEWPFIHVEGW